MTETPPEASPPARHGLRQQVFGLWAVVAIGVITVLVGGILGYTLGRVTDHQDDRFGPPGRFGGGQRGPGGFGGPGPRGGFGGPGGLPGGAPSGVPTSVPTPTTSAS